MTRESQLYQIFSGGEHIPKFYEYGIDESEKYMVMQYLGPSLNSLFKRNGYQMSLKSVLMAGYQMISCIEYIHDCDFIHRDIKPENFLVGNRGEESKIYIIDFGLARKYVESDGKHVAFCSGKSFAGTARYGSISALQGNQQSRKDDLEAIGYVLIYLCKGTLPWVGLTGLTSKEKHLKIAESKLRHPIAVLCAGLPRELVDFFAYVRGLGFSQEPDYEFLRSLFESALARIGGRLDMVFDWCPQKPAAVKFQPPVIEIPKRKEERRHRRHRQPSTTTTSDSDDELPSTIGLFLRRRGINYTGHAVYDSLRRGSRL